MALHHLITLSEKRVVEVLRQTEQSIIDSKEANLNKELINSYNWIDEMLFEKSLSFDKN